MWDKIERLEDIAYIIVAINKGTIIMVFDGSYLPNINYSRGFLAWLIHYNETDGYAWVSFPTTPQIKNTHISYLTVLYTILQRMENG